MILRYKRTNVLDATIKRGAMHQKVPKGAFQFAITQSNNDRRVEVQE